MHSRSRWTSHTACALVALGSLLIASPALAQTYGGGGPDINQATQERFDGPKARIAVAQFTNKSGKGQAAGIGNGMADMLATALFQSGRFIVLERQTLQDVIGEQDLGASGRVRRETAAPIGQIEGAEILVTAAITEFEAGSSGGEAGFGAAGQRGGGTSNLAGRLFGNVVGKLAGSFQSSHIALDMRLVDTRTSRIVAATSVKGAATDIAGLGGLAGGGLSGELSGFSKTPMEKAIRLAIQNAVQFVLARTPAQYYRPAQPAPQQAYQQMQQWAAPPQGGFPQGFQPAPDQGGFPQAPQPGFPQAPQGFPQAGAPQDMPGQGFPQGFPQSQQPAPPQGFPQAPGQGGFPQPGGFPQGGAMAPPPQPAAPPQPKMTVLKASFIPGEKTLFYDDFTDMGPDDAPPHFKVRGAAPQLMAGGGIRQLSVKARGSLFPNLTSLPQNFTFETEMMLDVKQGRADLTLILSSKNKEILQWWVSAESDELKLVVSLRSPYQELGRTHVPVNLAQPVKLALWVQNGRMRSFVNGEKHLDFNQVEMPPVDKIEMSHGFMGKGPMLSYRLVRFAESTPDFSKVISSSGRYVTYGIKFDTDSDRLKPESAPVIQSIARGLEANPNLKLIIEGHTDSVGNADHNLDLSKRRAEAVKAVLVTQFKVDPSRLEAVGLGASKPLGSNDTPQGRAQNRRVELVKK